VLPSPPDRYFVLYWEYHSAEAALPHLRFPLLRLLTRLERVAALPASICLVDGVDGLRGISASVSKADALRRSVFYKGPGAIVLEPERFAPVQPEEVLSRARPHLRTALANRDLDSAHSLVGDLFAEVRQRSAEPVSVHRLVESLLVEIAYSAASAGMSVSASLPTFDTCSQYAQRVRGSLDALETISGSESSLPTEIERARAFIDHHLHERVSLESLADHVHMNKSYLSRRFKQEIGVSFSQYVMVRRVEQAKRLLQNTRKTIEQITQEIGLEDSGHFYRIFKKVTGSTPGRFRK
jgi:AraC-like DNA-binding protein